MSSMKLTLVFLDCYNGLYNTVLYSLETLQRMDVRSCSSLAYGVGSSLNGFGWIDI